MLRQPLEDPPLARGRVLKFVDEEVLREPDAAPACRVERAVSGGGADEPRDVVERHHPVACREPIRSGGVVVEEITERLGLVRRPREEHRSGQRDHRPERTDHGGIDRLALVRRLACQDLRHHALREQGLPIGCRQGRKRPIAGLPLRCALELELGERPDR
jgi:hypothetical protein